jgi:hypothetical protein
MNIVSIYARWLFCLFALTVSGSAGAQVPGCTDPLAMNYNIGATQNDGSCIYSQGPGLSPFAAYLLDSILSETSGLIVYNDQLWTHNDNSDITLYGLDTASGIVLNTAVLSGTINIDWEEISQDSHYLYIGDFGNNVNGNRTDLKILRVDKTSLSGTNPVIDTISFFYQDQVNFNPTGSNNTDYDCEAFIVSDDSVYLFTKQWIGDQCAVYSLPKSPGTHMANFKSKFNTYGMITGATSLEGKRLIALSGYTNFLEPFIYLLYDYPGTEFFGGNKRRIELSLQFHQVEGIASNNGLKYYLSNELFYSPPFLSRSRMHIVDLSSYLSHYLNNTITQAEDYDAPNALNIFPNPAGDYIHVRASMRVNTENYLILNMLGKPVQEGILQNSEEEINISELGSGLYLFKTDSGMKKLFQIQ